MICILNKTLANEVNRIKQTFIIIIIDIIILYIITIITTIIVITKCRNIDKNIMINV